MQAANGTVVHNNNGTLTYTPNDGFSGTDTFTYRATDGQLLSAPATVTITVTPDVTGTYLYEMTTPKDIPDNGFITDEIVVTESFSILDINVEINIDHTRVRDLVVNLIGPNGQVIELANRVGGAKGQNFTGTTFDDSATLSITEGSAPFTDSFRPTGDLSALEGLDVNGTWTLEIYDVQKRESGTLQSWSISVQRGANMLATADVVDGVVAEPQPATADDIGRLADAAVARWFDDAGVDADRLARLQEVSFELIDLPGNLLGFATWDVIYIDTNAAGHGWFIDETPLADEEFVAGGTADILSATSENRALNSMDLLTVIGHEIGHLLGLEDGHDDGLMSGTLEAGTRLELGDSHRDSDHDSHSSALDQQQFMVRASMAWAAIMAQSPSVSSAYATGGSHGMYFDHLFYRFESRGVGERIFTRSTFSIDQAWDSGDLVSTGGVSLNAFRGSHIWQWLS